ncbi:scarecrow-like protein 14 [Lolium rigidum]|uniref:scarecrow-like protein 14 n=1 Tax=Lolium rigidum TaxID=89674 RepID=UPI001F5CBBEA|nr:scarecrow-like protein 14 [Lolium rigidum]
MAGSGTPEEFLGQQLGFLARLEPPSPSLFVDLPPTPQCEEDGDSSFDDMVLPYISRLLMEEGTDDHFFLYPDHPALLRAQLPFAQILVDAIQSASGSASTSTLSPSSSSSDGDATASPTRSTASPYDAVQISWSPAATGSPDTQSSALLNGETEQPSLGSGFFDGNGLLSGDKDMLNLAFLKGMEEARKFLPPNSSLTVDIGSTFAVTEEDRVPAGGGLKKRRDMLEPEASRATKLMMPEQEEDGARELFDEMMFQEQEICMKGVQQLCIPMDGSSRKGSGKRGRPRKNPVHSEMVDLHTLLLHCAEALSTDNRRGASELLKRIKHNSNPLGDAAQRLAYYFAEGLEARLAGRGSELYQSLMVRRTSATDFLKANQLLMAACCCKKVAFVFANKTICNAVAGRGRLHIVDYGLNQGFQWPGLLRVLAAREGGPPEVRITGIDLPQPGFRGSYHIEEVGRRLSNFARVFGVPFKFHGIAAKLETVKPEDLNIDRDEVLVVISLCHFRLLMDENLGFDSPSPRDQVLNNIREMRPDVFIHGILNGSYGATYFLTRFREALFHYSAQFDLLDATVPRDNNGRLLLERDIIGRSALNVIACEGADRVERPETYKQWQLRNHRAGLRQLPLNPEVVKLVLDKVKDSYHKDFVVDGDQRWLLHRWKGRVLYAWSAWIADNAS